MRKASEQRVNVSARLRVSDLDLVQDIARREGVSPTRLVTQVIERFIDDERERRVRATLAQT